MAKTARFTVLTHHFIIDRLRILLCRTAAGARERYQLLLDEYPELIKRVPDNQLASWLGVVPATFSRLKTAFANQNKTP